MKIFIAGATGRVAENLIKRLSQMGHDVYAGARRPEKVISLVNVHPVALDLQDDVSTLVNLIDGMDAVYFVAGSRGQDLLQTDAFGAVKFMQASEKAGVKRFLLLSSVFADRPSKWNDPALRNITNYNIAKFFADQWLIQNTNLDYTIIQPGNLQETKGSGKIMINVDESMPNSIENVAMVLAESLEIKETIKKVITMADGEIPVKTALKTI